jgi:biopolymer transport protein ExbB
MGLLVLAVIVMVTKALYLNAIESQNRTFLAAYDAEKTNDDALDPRIRMDLGTVTPASTLAGVYAKGMDELSKRLPSTGHMELAHQSTEAIRAAMEATVTRQGQKHSAHMVVLTIAISGGPFLGLLGTVVGVMITFAAIAASGEVNVNAIAPGVAAALAATVAGLAVAIPSLFGYNWLNLRIKAVSADTRVFVDEVVARIAEKYR